MPIETRCRRCGETFSPEPRAIAAGPGWRLCPRCREEDRDAEPTGRCGACGRPLRAGGRAVCGRCLGVAL